MVLLNATYVAGAGVGWGRDKGFHDEMSLGEMACSIPTLFGRSAAPIAILKALTSPASQKHTNLAKPKCSTLEFSSAPFIASCVGGGEWSREYTFWKNTGGIHLEYIQDTFSYFKMNGPKNLFGEQKLLKLQLKK